MATVRLENITRSYDSATAIEGISLNIPDGQFWVLVGPSGCGKSTILRTIAGLEKATSGDIYIGDRLVNDIMARDRNVAMVFQNYALYPHLTVAENLAFGLKMRGTDSTKIEQRIQEVARSLSIEHLLSRKPKQLSGGQQQRVALGRAIAREPDVFLLDEPLSNLDAQLRDDTRAELKQLHQRLGITTIYVTHDQVEAMTLADRIVILEQGRIQQVGTPQQVYSKPANRMVATFLGNPPMNIIPATYGNSLFWVGSQSVACPMVIREKIHPQEGQRFELGIRPEHLQLNLSESETDPVEKDVWALDKVPLELEVSVVEPLGRETLVRATWPSNDPKTVQGNILQLMASPSVRVRPGDRIPVTLDLNYLMIFDPATGKVL
ncbi:MULTISPECIES: ABC transporter ATP-binding protein [Limnospira]|uniref:ABC transporter related n=2 Tax=Limnospira TaxID=2596745 RepID=B5VZ66_LIMMA|nr:MULTISPECIES: sn-glycerol-3-phosphate ABC transporter ATP-binding protein UgpC [Limnospira]EKD10142.1 putative sugar ABC transporter ATP-binding protein [Arthrospira platensis C1]MDC0839094.1 sn-glycerol-3-phosphate ABC transporter ATP-binding protein UgpC [Limnoraphis robusta]QJB28551.1 sn-glycerol-3-phosphate ABC transporter ATP-binding protein UgpC [Limnospira fusiformis SAG 85.79]RAQ39553.1 sn-glycerol-3-phosphate ABC transporter ATP-binding protein UgpC [Arthrospira sp. O9.13F]EDZ95538